MIKCPSCDKEIEVKIEKGREIAYCDCGTGNTRPVYEKYPPVEEPPVVRKGTKK